MMSLQEELDKVRSASNADERVRTAYETLLTQLGASDLRKGALKVGDTMPSFVLPNAKGQLVFSDELLERGPLVVTFFRGSWCPYCRHALDALELALPQIVGAGGQLVALTPDTGGSPNISASEHRLTYEILSDVDGAVGLQFGILFRTPDLYRALLIEKGIDLPARHGNENWFIPVPATFIVGQDAVIRYAFVNVDFARRAEPEEIVSELRSIKDGKPQMGKS